MQKAVSMQYTLTEANVAEVISSISFHNPWGQSSIQKVMTLILRNTASF